MTRTAVIAGVGPRIGESVARKCANEGCSIGLFARSAEYLDDLADELTEETDGEAMAVPTDITDPAQVAAGFETVREAYGPVDLLVNNAYPTGENESGLAAPGEGPLGSAAAAFERSWQVWAKGAFHCSEEAAADMLDTDGGTIIFTGSGAAVRGTGSAAHHSAGFAGRGLARSLAHELWPTGIHVAHVLVDGPVGAPGHRDWSDQPDAAWIHPDHVADTYWHLVEQPKSAWTLELDIRAHAGDISFG
ncbi:MAG: SDR family NAD(P)-dependent oxidoreductase [Halobacteriales archaeon]|nr:SDR family NAD(P)-dependent oxidoreductase [Halobacteriales archaeon]